MALMGLALSASPVLAVAVQVEMLLAGLTDTDGEPLDGGLVYTYIAGTTTAKSTWTTSAKAVTCANPIVLDSYGRATAFADGSYKFVIKTSAGVTLYTWDTLEYTSAVSPTTMSITTLSATIGTIASLTAESFFSLANGTISTSTISNSTIGAPEITNASMSAPILYGASLSAPIISNATFSGNTQVATPTTTPNIANKGYVDYAFDSVATPTLASEAANKSYVDYNDNLNGQTDYILPTMVDYATPTSNSIVIAANLTYYELPDSTFNVPASFAYAIQTFGHIVYGMTIGSNTAGVSNCYIYFYNTGTTAYTGAGLFDAQGTSTNASPTTIVTPFTSSMVALQPGTYTVRLLAESRSGYVGGVFARFRGYSGFRFEAQ